MPSTRRRLCAFLLATLAPAAVVALLFAVTGSPATAGPAFLIAFLIAAMHVLIIAMPLYAVLALHWPPTFWRVLLAAFLVGVGPLTLVGGVSAITSAPSGEGWFSMVIAMLVFGGIGMSGGLAFWLVINPPRDRAEQSGSCR